MPPTTQPFEKFCPRCEHFDHHYGVCVKFHENIRDYPARFLTYCNGKFFALSKDPGVCSNCGAKLFGASTRCPKCNQPIEVQK